MNQIPFAQLNQNALQAATTALQIAGRFGLTNIVVGILTDSLIGQNPVDSIDKVAPRPFSLPADRIKTPVEPVKIQPRAPEPANVVVKGRKLPGARAGKKKGGQMYQGLKYLMDNRKQNDFIGVVPDNLSPSAEAEYLDKYFSGESAVARPTDAPKTVYVPVKSKMRPQVTPAPTPAKVREAQTVVREAIQQAPASVRKELAQNGPLTLEQMYEKLSVGKLVDGKYVYPKMGRLPSKVVPNVVVKGRKIGKGCALDENANFIKQLKKRGVDLSDPKVAKLLKSDLAKMKKGGATLRKMTKAQKEWHNHVEKVAKAKGLDFFDALKVASKSYKKK